MADTEQYKAPVSRHIFFPVHIFGISAFLPFGRLSANIQQISSGFKTRFQQTFKIFFNRLATDLQPAFSGLSADFNRLSAVFQQTLTVFQRTFGSFKQTSNEFKTRFRGLSAHFHFGIINIP